MLLKLIRNKRTRCAFRCSLIERDPFSGDRLLASVTESLNNPMSELFYPVSVTRSGICLRGQPVEWHWPSALQRRTVEDYLYSILKSGEQIYLEITRPAPLLPGYPYVNHNGYDNPQLAVMAHMVEQEKNDEDA